MTITRISNSQIRFVLTKTDLDERNITADDLAGGSDKTQRLVREIRGMLPEHDFHYDNMPLMMEIAAADEESVMVLVTKMDIADMVRRLDAVTMSNIVAGLHAALCAKRGLQPVHEHASPDDKGLTIFSFDSLDNAALAAGRLSPDFDGDAQLFKHKDRFFLALHGIQSPENLLPTLLEYGDRHMASVLSVPFLAEHGEMLIADNAVKKLAAYINAI